MVTDNIEIRWLIIIQRTTKRLHNDDSEEDQVHCRSAVLRPHKRRSSVNFGVQDIFARKYMHEKLKKCPNFTSHLPEKLTKVPNFTWYTPEKCPNFTWFLPENYIFFPNLGASAPPAPVSYAYVHPGQFCYKNIGYNSTYALDTTTYGHWLSSVSCCCSASSL